MVKVNAPGIEENGAIPGRQLSLVISIVSHGHGAEVECLLEELAFAVPPCLTRVVLTQNLPEPAPRLAGINLPFVLELRTNAQPLGFGANHNRALCAAIEECVGVVNPDVRLRGCEPFTALTVAAAQPGVACAYPRQWSQVGCRQDSERELPTPWKLFLRNVLRRREIAPDWVNAACLVMRRSVWEQLGGFDERYFMYCEDVDLSLRLRSQVGRLACADADIVHDGRRNSRRNMRHLFWHISSLVRLWRSPVYQLWLKTGRRT